MKNNETTIRQLINILISMHCLYIYSSQINEFKNNKGQIILTNGDELIVQINIAAQDNLESMCKEIVYNGVRNEFVYVHNIELSPQTAELFLSNILFNETEFFRKYFVTIKPNTLTTILDNTLKAYKSGTYYK